MKETVRTQGQREVVTPESLDMGTIEQAIEKAQRYLLRMHNERGYWVGELTADVTVTAGYIPLMYFMLDKVEPERVQKIVNYIISKQYEDGSWGTYYGASGDLNVTIQTYFALKLAGVPATERYMERARDFVLAKGGISRANTLTKVWLALFGQYDWRGTPSIPPEVMLLPNWFYLNIYEFASWSRATIVALTVVVTKRPVCSPPDSAKVSELYVEPEGQRSYSLGKIRNVSWRSFFLVLDCLFKTYERMPWKPGRNLAWQRVERWIVKHQEADGSWGGIMLPWIYSLIALKCMGYKPNHPVIEKGLRGLDDFIIEDTNTFRLQPATSPIWDTAWALIALRESGLAADHPSLVKTARWLLEKEIRVGGDWQVNNFETEPGCWAFEFENNCFPDVDDTAVVSRALLGVQLPGKEDTLKHEAIERGRCWVVSMQSKNGGWAAFDRDNDKTVLEHIPFADFMTPLDPTSPDVTAHAIELLGELRQDDSSLSKAISYLKREQEYDGSWYGRWGVNYVYGTGLVLASLLVAGEEMAQDYIRRAVSWLFSFQNEDGGWGETCDSYEDPQRRGTGPSTASQTAWALIGLIAANEHASPVVRKGICYLVRVQKKDGSWDEDAYTGTGFPGAFYLRYDFYRLYFSLLALVRYRAALKEESLGYGL